MNPEDLQPASYKGAPFFVSGASTAGGRKSVTKPFVDSDLQVVEDLGLLQRSFTVRGTVAARRDAEGSVVEPYLEVRRRLLEALESGGPGILVHPFFGRLENISCLSFVLDENVRELGDAPIEITFAVSNTDGRPQPQATVLSSVTKQTEEAKASVIADLAERFGVDPSFTGNFAAAVDKVSSFAEKLGVVTAVSSASEDQLDAFSSQLADYQEEVTSLVGSPQALADSTVSLFETTNGLFPTPRATLDAFVRLFDFGDADAEVFSTTAGLQERRTNQAAFNSSIQALALAHAYENAARIEYATVEEIDEASRRLEAQFQKIAASPDVDSAVEEELTQQRIAVTSYLNQQRITKPRVITVRTGPTSARLLAYQYYGSSELGRTIAELNGLSDSSFLEGDARILTE